MPKHHSPPQDLDTAPLTSSEREELHRLRKEVKDLRAKLAEVRLQLKKRNAGVILGGREGGRARAEKLSPEQRKAIAQKAAASRWKKQE